MDEEGGAGEDGQDRHARGECRSGGRRRPGVIVGKEAGSDQDGKKDILGLGRGSRAGEMLDEKRTLEVGDDGWEPPVGERRTCHLQTGPTHQSSTSAQRGKTA